MSWIKIILLVALCCVALAQVDERGLIVKKVLKNEKISLRDGVEHEVTLNLNNIVSQNDTDTLQSHMILIEIKSYPDKPEEVDMREVIDVYSKMNAPGHLQEFIDIKDTFPVIESDQTVKMVYHYIIYDLCYLKSEVKEPASIQIKFKSLKGDILSQIDAKLVEFKTLKINCVDPTGDWFLPREDHTSCQTWDKKVWVYGGRRNVDKEIVVMDDVMYFDSQTNKWHKGADNSRVKPKARYAHVMFCYYNYLIVFGGMSHGGELLGDLWVYDVTKELWYPIIDNKNLLELQTLNVSGIIPKERAYASGVMMKIIGAAYMVGGRNADGFACDLWALKVDKIIQHIEDPDTVGIENFWIKKQFDENEDFNALCRFGHSSEEVTNSTFLVYGGVNKRNKVITMPLLYDVVEQTLTELDEKGLYIPPPRNKPSLLATGNKMILMYGGIDTGNKGYLKDLWHLKIEGNTVLYEKVIYDTKGTAYMVSWRTGCSVLITTPPSWEWGSD